MDIKSGFIGFVIGIWLARFVYARLLRKSSEVLNEAVKVMQECAATRDRAMELLARHRKQTMYSMLPWSRLN
jgi:hypothetical protein